MDQHKDWFEKFRQSSDFTLLSQRPIAYFCAEFALTDESPTYAGGLGVLAGDMVREAADQKVPFVAVGLFYHEGYLHHELYSDGTMLKHPRRKNPEELGFRQVLHEDKTPLFVEVPIQGRNIKVTAWEFKIGTVSLFVLDTDIPENDQNDRHITNRLYVANKETRFKQEMVLGIGGQRLLEALNIHPYIYHLNEGHSAMLVLELSRHEMKEHQKGFPDALYRAKQHVVFTNHTLVAAGNDMFNSDMVSILLNDYAVQLQVPVQELVAFGVVEESSIFSMTMLALRLANRTNAVSELHTKKANELWKQYPMTTVTNGIHIDSWDKLQVKNETSVDIWQKHQENKRSLLQEIFKRTGQQWSEKDLLLGWARRMVRYKRPLALFEDKERLKSLLKDEKRPIKVVIAGSAHESDVEGAEMLEQLQEMIVNEFHGYVVYLPNYDLKEAKLMTSGCDVWLNTPVVGFEACGTSGMKGCLNGVLPCSTKDGWVAEVETYGIGWIVDSDTINQSLISTISQQIMPMYYYQDKTGFPGAWVENMQRARLLILQDFSATKMLRKYVETMYLPSIATIQKDLHE